MLTDNARYTQSNKKISNKKPIIRQRKLKLELLKNHLKASTIVIANVHICSILVISDDKLLTKQKQIEDRKIIRLIKGNGKGTDPEKVIFNFSSYMLSDNDNSFLPKGLHFLLPNKKIETQEYICPSDIPYRQISDFSQDSTDK